MNKKNISPKVNKYTLVMILGILIISGIVFRKYLFEGYYFITKGIWSDLLRANLPTYYLMFDSIKNGTFWSWKMGIGTSIFSHGDVLFDPFTYIIFILGRSRIPQMMVVSLIVKLVFEGVAIKKYLDEFKMDGRAKVIAAILYSFSGYSLIMGNNLVLGTILVYAPIVLLGIERWIKNDSKKILYVGLFLTCIYSYYFFYIMGIVCVIYLIIREWGKKSIIKKLKTLAGMAIMVMLLGMFSLMPQIKLVLSNSRVSTGKDIEFGIALFIPQIKTFLTAIVRTLSLEVLGSGMKNQYGGYSYFLSQDYFQVSCYFSSLFWIAVCHLWKYKEQYRKKLKIIGIVVSCMITFPIVSYIFNAFSTINARWMFTITIVQTVVFAYAIDSIIEKKRLNLLCILEGIAFSIISYFVAIIYMSVGKEEFILKFISYIKRSSKNLSILLIIFALVLLSYSVQSIKNNTNISKYIIYCIVFITVILDITSNYDSWYSSKEALCEYSTEDKSSYNDVSSKVIKQLMKDDSQFYRIDKTFDSVYDNSGNPSLNDSMVQGYYGIKCYNSLNNQNYIKFLQKSGIYVAYPANIQNYILQDYPIEEIKGSELNFISGVQERYKIMSYLGVKYLISDSKIEDNKFYKDYIEEDGIYIYINKYFMPLAYVNNYTIKESEFSNLTNEQKDNIILTHTIVHDDYGEVSTKKNISDDEVIDNIEQNQENFELTHFSENNIKFNINVSDSNGKKSKMSLVIPYDNGWNIYIDGKKVKTEEINNGLLGCNITSGKHSVKIIYTPIFFRYGIVISCMSIIICGIYIFIKNRNIGLKLKVLKICKKNIFRFLLLVSVQLIIICVYIILGKLHYATNDDTTMVALAGGGYVTPSQYIVNMHIVLGMFLKLLFTYLPYINWITILFIGVYIFSFTLLDYHFVFKMKNTKQKFLIYFMVINLILIILLGHFTFTVVSYISGSVAIIIFLYNDKKVKSSENVFALISLLMCLLIRAEAIKSLFIVIILCCLYELIRYKNKNKILIGIAIVLLMYGSIFSNTALVNMNEHQKEFYDWGEIRSAALDCAAVPYDADEFDSKNISAADYSAIYGAFYYVKDAISTSKLNSISEMNGINIKYNFDIGGYIKNQISTFNTMQYDNLYKWIFILIVVLGVVIGDSKTRKETGLILLGVITADLVFYIIQRSVYRVVMPTYVFAIMLLVINFNSRFKNYKHELLRYKRNIFAIEIIFVSILSLLCLKCVFEYESKNAYVYSEYRQQALEYLKEHNDTLYLAGNPTVFSLDVCDSVWDYSGKGERWNLIGNWEIYSVPSDKLVNSYGYYDTENILEYALNNNKIQILTTMGEDFEDYGQFILDLYKQYYGIRPHFEKVDNIVTGYSNGNIVEKWCAYKLVY